MKVALIVPDKLIQTVGFRTNYHMVLPSELRRQEYSLPYKQLAEHNYIILDNGIAEGTSYGMIDLLDMAAYIGADEIVVPDVMGDGLASCELAKRFEEGLLAKTYDKYAFMAVAHGKTFSELYSSIEYYISQDWINTIAFPRCLQIFGDDARFEAIAYWIGDIIAAGKEVHCLGSTSDLTEVKRLAEFSHIRGIDTCMPLDIIRAGVSLSQGEARYMGRAPNYFTWVPTEAELELVNFNVTTYLTWANAPEMA
jgi:hypothetical protein